MPQLFQVLKCFRCSVFQVHTTKKSNKWECKLCSEKQSIKRHYGLGTGKECRLHVQKLNGIRGTLDEINEIAKLNESSNEEVDIDVPKKKQANLEIESKWSEFVDKSENVQAAEPESMYIGNAEVVLEVPAKQRKFGKHKVTNYTSVATTYPMKTENYSNVQGSCENQMAKVNTNCNKIHSTSHQTESEKPRKKPVIVKTNLLDKNSKWTQYVEVAEANDNWEDDFSPHVSNVENISVIKDTCNISNGNLRIDNNENSKNKSKDIPKNLFSLCEENDLDDVLDL